MNLLSTVKIFLIVTFFCAAASAQDAFSELDKNYLSWSEKQASQYGAAWRETGRVGGFFDNRILSTDKAYNYKLRATLMSPEVVRAAARREQLRNGLTEDETRKLVAEAEAEKSLIVLIEIDPREGSGVIPNEWRALLQTKGLSGELNKTARGVKNQALRNTTALKGVSVRNYDYDVFWVVFPLKNEKGSPLWTVVPNEIELVVGIYNKEGRVAWKVSDALKTRIGNLLKE